MELVLEDLGLNVEGCTPVVTPGSKDEIREKELMKKKEAGEEYGCDECGCVQVCGKEAFDFFGSSWVTCHLGVLGCQRRRASSTAGWGRLSPSRKDNNV